MRTSKASSSVLRPPAARYGVSLAAVLAALALKLAFRDALGHGSILFPLATLVAAIFGGFGPGLLATLLSVGLTGTLFLDDPLEPTSAAMRLSVILIQGVAISGIAQAFLRAASKGNETHQRAVAILESLGDACFFVDRDWRFTYVSQLYFARYPVAKGDLIGRSLWEAYPELLGTIIEERYRLAMKTGEPQQFESRSLISERWFRVNVYPTGDGLAVSATDLTGLKRVEEDLRAAKEEAERRNQQLLELAAEARTAREAAENANRIKDQFLATLSHELRTPLNAIYGWAQLLRGQKVDAEGLARGLEAIERNSRAQMRLVEDLLDTSRIASGNLRLELTPTPVNDVVEAALGVVLPAAEAKGVHLERDLDAGPGLVMADPARLQQVFWNLLSNAVKFTPRDGRVRVVTRPDDGFLEARVEDTGQGIRPEFLPHAFDFFRQGDASTTRRQGGLGLGLSIVRRLVELHGGTVWAESDGDGQGAAFVVRLPLAMADSPAPGDSQGQAAGDPAHAPLAGLRLLLVEDEPDTLSVMTELLTLRGAEVTGAASAAEALEKLKDCRPDLLVSDIGMPGKDGYDLIREVRASGLGAEALPAVAVTAFASAEDRQRALDAGFQAHLAKPIRPDELTRTLADMGRRS
ncbi:MAG: ATP-binding protein [Thermoanaerobaculia bacterium]